METSEIERLFVQYADDVHQFLVYFTRERDVDDLVQEVFIKGLRSLPQFRGDASPRTWLLSIARGVAIDHTRRRKRERYIGDASIPFLPSDGSSVEEQVEFGDFLVQLMSALNSKKLTRKPGYREVVICRAVMDMSASDTAGVLGWTVNRVNVTYHRALKLIREIMEIRDGGGAYEFANGK